MSPLSFVRFTGKPAGMACWNIATSPARAALKRRVASSRASGGRDEGSAGGELVELKPLVTFAPLTAAMGAWEDGEGSRGRGMFDYIGESFVVGFVDLNDV